MSPVPGVLPFVESLSDIRSTSPGVTEFPTMEMTLRFYLLGELRVKRRDELLPVPPQRTWGLLAALLLAPGPQRRENLIGRLFPDAPESAGRRRLSDLLWLLRRNLPELPLIQPPNSHDIGIPASARWTDVEQFRSAADSVSLADWLEGLALYCGDLLVGAPDEWLVVEREMLYLTWVRTAHQACNALLEQRRYDYVIPIAESLVRAEPYDEQGLRILMAAYRAIGRRGAALAAYERFVTIAATELDLQPEVATQELAATIRQTAVIAPEPIECTWDTRSVEKPLAAARAALARGEWTGLAARIEQLRDDPACHPQDRQLLAIDLALATEAYEEAGRLLAMAKPWRSAERTRAAFLALTRHDLEEARLLAAEALVWGHEEADVGVEMDALLAMVRVELQSGRFERALRSAEQALTLARRLGEPEGIARALVSKGLCQYHQGRYGRAMVHFCEARSVASEHRLQPQSGHTLQGIRLVQCNTGKVIAALETLQEELAVWRDLGLARREAEALEGLALIYDLLGRSDKSLAALALAMDISQQTGDPVRVAICRYNLACSLIYHGDGRAREAIAVAQNSLETFRAHRQNSREAAVLTILGYAHWVAGEPDRAAAVLAEAVAACQDAGALHRLPELRAYQALAHLDLGATPKAEEYARQALLAMTEGEVSREVVPDIYYACATVRAAAGDDSQAKAYLEKAYQLLLTDAGQLADDDARQAFFHRSPTTRRVMVALRERGLGPPTGQVVTQRLTGVLGRPVDVRWTVDAGPPDVALQQMRGAVALRRARLARLLREARGQGGRPSIAQLAEALGVSLRTVQRDLAAFERDSKLREEDT